MKPKRKPTITGPQATELARSLPVPKPHARQCRSGSRCRRSRAARPPSLPTGSQRASNRPEGILERRKARARAGTLRKSPTPCAAS